MTNHELVERFLTGELPKADERDAIRLINMSASSGVCPRDGKVMKKIPNPRQAPGFGHEFVCECGFRITD